MAPLGEADPECRLVIVGSFERSWVGRQVMWSNERELRVLLGEKVSAASKQVAALDPDYLLSENEDVLLEQLTQGFPEPVTVDWDGVTRGQVTEATAELHDRFEPGRVFKVPASRIVLSFPTTGTLSILDYQASTFTMGPKHGVIAGSTIVLEIVERDLTAEIIQNAMARLRQDVDKRVMWANNDLANFRAEAMRSLRQVLDARRQRILADRSLDNALGIPVRAATTHRQPVPAKRKRISLQQRREQARFVPEAVLDEAIYKDILDAIHAWARSLERTPRTADKLDEEELRDLLLGTLNGYWQGAAGGELFNGNGKTDILIRHEDRNVFIAECKIWRGQKGASEAVDQLLRYLVWRDSKAALVMFIKTADPAATIEKLAEAVREHPAHILSKQDGDPTRQSDFVLAADDEGRRVSLAVLPVVVTHLS